MSDSLPPAQAIWKEIQPYSQRLGLAIAVFAIITIWFFSSMPPFLKLTFLQRRATDV
jgi:hypothetical protein